MIKSDEYGGKIVISVIMKLWFLSKEYWLCYIGLLDFFSSDFGWINCITLYQVRWCTVMRLLHFTHSSGPLYVHLFLPISEGRIVLKEVKNWNGSKCCWLRCLQTDLFLVLFLVKTLIHPYWDNFHTCRHSSITHQ